LDPVPHQTNNNSIALACLAALGCAFGALAQAMPPRLIQAEPPNLVAVGGYAPGYIMVQLGEGAVPGTTLSKRGSVEPTLLASGSRREIAGASKALAAAGIVSLRSPFIAPPRDAKAAHAIGLDRWYRADLAPGRDPAVVAAKLARLGGAIARAEVDPEGGLAEIPNDPDFFTQYALQNTGQTIGGQAGLPNADVAVTAAWNFTHGSNLIVAVLDSGIDPHPEFASRILPGINVPDGTTITTDECGHGTHVAGILAASGNNAMGIAGIAWNARLLPVVVVNGCTGFEANVSTGLTWAVDQGARIVNMSLQFYAGNQFFLDAIRYANGQGALLIAATGNNGNTTIAAPARWNETIAVAATDNRDQHPTFSNYGAEVDLCAPGVSVWSTIGSTGYTSKTGTSMSVPHVTGAAVLLWSYNPSLTRDQVRAYLIAGVDDIGAAGSDVYFGAGRLDIANSLALVPPPYRVEDLDRNGVIDARDLAIVLSAWGSCVNCDSCIGDIDGDCTVGPLDLARVLSAW